MCTNYRGIELALAVWRQEEKMHYGQFFVKCSRRPHNSAQLTLCRLLDEIDCEIYTTKKNMFKACKTLLDMQICGGVVVVFIMLSQVP